MFSGIISALGNVKNITYKDIYSVDIEITKINLEDFEKSDNLIKIGCSIACSGVCLTLTEKKDNVLTFDISKETMNKTNLSDWKIGSLVNLERALRVGDEIGGHFFLSKNRFLCKCIILLFNNFCCEYTFGQ